MKGNRMKIHFSSKSNEWETPQKLFDLLDKEFGFTLDPCATDKNAKCADYFTKQEDGLTKDWTDHAIFMNPPYGHQISRWVKKAYNTAQISPYPVVCLLPARTDTRWWHDYCMRAAEIRFIKGRLKFSDCENSAPFPSAIVIFKSPLGKLPELNIPICSSFTVHS